MLLSAITDARDLTKRLHTGELSSEGLEKLIDEKLAYCQAVANSLTEQQNEYNEWKVRIFSDFMERYRYAFGYLSTESKIETLLNSEATADKEVIEKYKELTIKINTYLDNPDMPKPINVINALTEEMSSIVTNDLDDITLLFTPKPKINTLIAKKQKLAYVLFMIDYINIMSGQEVTTANVEELNNFSFAKRNMSELTVITKHLFNCLTEGKEPTLPKILYDVEVLSAVPQIVHLVQNDSEIPLTALKFMNDIIEKNHLSENLVMYSNTLPIDDLRMFTYYSGYYRELYKFTRKVPSLNDIVMNVESSLEDALHGSFADLSYLCDSGKLEGMVTKEVAKELLDAYNEFIAVYLLYSRIALTLNQKGQELSKDGEMVRSTISSDVIEVD